MQLKFEDIRPHGNRWEAYMLAKATPRLLIKFQGENGLNIVRYTPAKPANEIMPGLTDDPKPGYWFEKPVEDITKVNPDANTIGFRVTDPEMDED